MNLCDYFPHRTNAETRRIPISKDKSIVICKDHLIYEQDYREWNGQPPIEWDKLEVVGKAQKETQ